MNKAVWGWVIVTVAWAGLAVVVERFFGTEAGKWFFTGAMSIVITSMFVVGFSKKVSSENVG